jgi:hypothetical protein
MLGFFSDVILEDQAELDVVEQADAKIEWRNVPSLYLRAIRLAVRECHEIHLELKMAGIDRRWSLCLVGAISCKFAQESFGCRIEEVVASFVLQLIVRAGKGTGCH